MDQGLSPVGPACHTILSADEFVTPGRGGELPWYAIRTQSKFEMLAATALQGKGFDSFIPLCRSRRRWSDRVKELDLPLFPGYLFCRLNVRGRLLPVLTTPGVMNIVGAGRTPIPVADEEIEAVQAMVQSGLPIEPHPFLNAGQKVRVERGPLTGAEGVIIELKKEFRLVASVTLLQRSVAIVLEREWVEPIS